MIVGSINVVGIIATVLVYLVPIALGFLVLYWVVRKAVRDGIRDARANGTDRA